ncbi:MAG: acyl-homoserine lactone synthase [Methylobacteriaceae bacterium]|jgi:acyl-homoserine lactone synthase|nr:acyl-homoserine lactone synthase [Methylobacteriaceae bacterium]
MAILITKHNLSRHNETLEKVYRFRHRFFVHHKKWAMLAKSDEREIDEFDTPEAVHIVGLDNSGDISTYTRLLATTGPHLLSEVYPELLQGNPEPIGPDIWEWTRAAINPFKRDSDKGASRIKGEFYAAVVEACLHLGIRALLVEAHPGLITSAIDVGFHTRPLALPTEYGGEPVVPFLCEVTEQTLPRTREVFGLSSPVLRVDEIGVEAPALERLAQ